MKMTEIFESIVSYIVLAKDARLLGIDIDKEASYKIKELANKLPARLIGPVFIVDGESVEQPNGEEMALFHSGQKLRAIKHYKERTGRSLMIAKHAIEQMP
jgi:ribosomal protein L7/L12